MPDCRSRNASPKLSLARKTATLFSPAVPGALWSDSPDRGLYRTTDGGKNWELALKGSNPSTGCSDRRDRSQRFECNVRRALGFSPQRLDFPFRGRRSERTVGQRIVPLDRRRQYLERDHTGEQQGFSQKTIWPYRGCDRAIEFEAGLRCCRINRQRALRFR